MPIIAQIGRRSLKVRLLIGAIYLVLSVGAVSMVYPFLLMVAGTTKSGVDTPEAKVIPDFLIDEAALYRKDAEGFFNEKMANMQGACNHGEPSFRKISPPDGAGLARLAEEWRAFLAAANLPHWYYEMSYIDCSVSRKTAPLHFRRFKAELSREFGGDLERMNRALDTEFINWSSFYLIPCDYVSRTVNPGDSPYHLRVQAFKAAAALEERYYFSPDGFYKNNFLKTKYTKDITAYNRTHGTEYSSWDQVFLPRHYPAGPEHTDRQRGDWEEFVRNILNLLWIRADEAALAPYREYLQAKYGEIAVVNRRYGTAYADFAAVPLPDEAPGQSLTGTDWAAFLQGWKDPATGKNHLAPVESLHIHSVDFMFRDHLAAKFGSLAAANAALGTGFKDWLEILPPQRDFLYRHWFQPRIDALRREFCARNFLTVFEYVLLRGRAVLNTVIYVVLAILCALVVNPLAAYALSRYKPPTAYKVLLFLMLTMAFPPMVTQIPNFLLLRELGLLNTFAALILPGMAHGYSVFLLKGFFDSLPQELYESAEIDGAGEIRIFLQITMSLSTPILAVIALNAFHHAYANFMMALLICQDQSMWTLMPWLYQLQMQAGQGGGVVFASLVIAAVPTFIVFAFCQNVIMRGIVVPVEK